ncbi:isocitrate lyase/phosphoenolpyruvate mutase family protein [Streptacidiphilus pinicola]|uniref:Isocitrate lyase/phosphoenolpyruvate mutase family protein n=1 Tax=Streptacidiphilus pinicola TaxID=2219663 RepID=A0A2X0K5V1_9ACTN|nr:isocitrate lyase/phosphoenolpyruvate mutase family protein [Streptacidiphilus pinicola]RAG82650.1 isocitrate lyase/phosphoenolpyruvate mutase family protein [Streptacidiphilus pinicola]
MIKADVELVEKARLFHSLHQPGRPLVLPNAWDVASARVVEAAGAAAVATTSAGVAWALGYADGGRLTREAGVAAIARIVEAVSVPVTADIERGYAEDLPGLAETIRAVIAAGAVGVNLEDSLLPIEESAARIAAAREAADALGMPLFINARIDTHRLPADQRDRHHEESVARAAAYAAAGASGVFVFGALSGDAVAALAKEITLPLNVTVAADTLPVATLAEAGAARISAGASIAEAAYGVADRAAREILSQGTASATQGGLDWPTLNGLFS